MGFFSQKTSKRTYVTYNTVQGSPGARVNVNTQKGGRSAVNLTTYDQTYEQSKTFAPQISIVADSPGAETDQRSDATLGGLTWQTWALIMGAVVLIVLTWRK